MASTKVDKAQIFCAISILCVMFALVSSRSVDFRQRRSADSSNECTKETPCAWEIYSRQTGEVIEHIDGPCVCAENMTCTKNHEEVSISSWVYTCKPN